MLLDIGTEEIAHIEMLATMVARLLEGASTKDQEAAAKDGFVVGAVMGGTSPKDMTMAAAMNPQHGIVTGTGAAPADSVGYPWNGRYVIASGNRLQAVRLYQMTTDAGVRDMLSFLIARDTMHQHQWIAAVQELEADGLETTPAPSAFPEELKNSEVANQYWNLSEGDESRHGRWGHGKGPRGREIEYLEKPVAMGEEPEAPQPDPDLFTTPKKR